MTSEQARPEPATRPSVHEQDVVILSGLSGGGKTAASKLFEDLGYTVVDNLPAEMLPELADLVSSDRQRFARVAIVVDVRTGNAPIALASMSTSHPCASWRRRIPERWPCSGRAAGPIRTRCRGGRWRWLKATANSWRPR